MNDYTDQLQTMTPRLSLDSQLNRNSKNSDYGSPMKEDQAQLSDRLDRLNITMAHLMHDFSLECGQSQSSEEFQALSMRDSLCKTSMRLKSCVSEL